MAAAPPGYGRYPNLFAPVTLGPVTLKHRATMAAHGMRLGDHTGTISARHRAYMVARAKGGASLVSASSLPVHESSQRFAGLQIRVSSDDLIPSLARSAEAIHRADAKFGITLWHAGYNVSPLAGGVTVAPSAVPNSRGEVPRALSLADIRELIGCYRDVARRCRQAGVDVLEVQTASDYLLGSFLSPLINRRTDAYGGSPENRLRIVAEILAVVREAAGPGIAVGVRTAVAHYTPGADNDYGVDDSVAAMAALAKAGLVDYVSLSAGTYRASGYTMPSMARPRMELTQVSRRFREVSGVPVIVAGRIRTAAEADGIIAEGLADVVAMARTWVADAAWAAKYAEGRDDEVRPCMSCNQACAGFLNRGLRSGCVLDPRSGREIEFPRLSRIKTRTALAVVGGGPAGLEAARLAAMRGFRVTLHEAGPALGGQLRLAANAPFRGEMLAPIAWWQQELTRLGVEVRLSSAVHDPRSLDAGTIVWATGATPAWTAVWRLRPQLFDGIPGAEGLAHGRTVMAGEAKVGGRVLVIDEEGGWPAVSLVEAIAAQSNVTSLTVACAERQLGEAELQWTREAGEAGERLKSRGVAVLAGSLVSRVDGRSVEFTDGRRLGPFDAIVLSTGTVSRPIPEGARGIGDCVAPRGLWAATTEALELVAAL